MKLELSLPAYWELINELKTNRIATPPNRKQKLLFWTEIKSEALKPRILDL